MVGRRTRFREILSSTHGSCPLYLFIYVMTVQVSRTRFSLLVSYQALAVCDNDVTLYG